ncbi:glycoside hydrolase family 43 protein [Kribbella monticola]|uniref:glycoside hydrolase family 43 protein n=1 Tax=Kribbella monticola TaxID=2185285 RepID=UPI000DD4DE35|nr:glycoside hydrolase family 43 protein [Kribbella monticola]
MAFTNPVYGDNFADPQVVAVDGSYYAFATNGPLGNVQTLKSADLVSWDQVGDALPELPAWTSPGMVWAPEVAVHAADRFVMYYTTSDTASGRQAIGVAVASDPKGPYVDKSSRPLICEAGQGGSIDASPFQDPSGQRWLYWTYAVGHARCATPAGPCTKSGDPVLTSSADAAGPGHNMVLQIADRWWFVYHAWDPALVGTDPHGRTMWLSELTWSGHTPYVQPPLKNNPVTPW